MIENAKPIQPTLFHGYSSNLCAWCHYHNVGVTVRQMKLKKCLGRQCGALEKYDHPIWKHRENIKELRKKRKEARALQYS